MAALVKYQGKVIYKKGFGWRTGQELTNSGADAFRIGSTPSNSPPC